MRASSPRGARAFGAPRALGIALSATSRYVIVGPIGVVVAGSLIIGKIVNIKV